MRVVRPVVGTVLLLLAQPLLLGGSALGLVAAQRDAGGGFSAATEPVATEGYAIVLPDPRRVLDRAVPMLGDAGTRVRVEAAPGLFLGLAPRGEVERYLAASRRLEVSAVRLARGALPVDAEERAPIAVPPRADVVTASPPDTAAVPPPADPAGAPGAPIAAPVDQPFWLMTSAERGGASVLSWSPGAIAAGDLALVVLNRDGTAGVRAALTVRLSLPWLLPATALSSLAGVGLLAGALIALWATAGRRSASGSGWNLPYPPPPVRLALVWPPTAPSHQTAPVRPAGSADKAGSANPVPASEVEADTAVSVR